jgi:hypothetical protein
VVFAFAVVAELVEVITKDLPGMVVAFLAQHPNLLQELSFISLVELVYPIYLDLTQDPNHQMVLSFINK